MLKKAFEELEKKKEFNEVNISEIASTIPSAE